MEGETEVMENTTRREGRREWRERRALMVGGRAMGGWREVTESRKER